ncbi:MAG: tetratricopeptide repeat protein [Gammaproteobacteria bacterium]|jgi:TPR repeat protein|nr:tetratricopeptide repeat protein [Gammaproteobacteria bacterium]MBT4492286.1 tetratricopeptide repeat protein [Gammaproteobacteria bacterium]MBT7370264.1 tetratricopeptide repeat protein [Gammaproteobacteria bacterium]
MRYVVISVLLLLASLVSAESSYFEEAQKAATEGRYEDVTTTLTTLIDTGGLEAGELAIALSNRGIAYSLLQRYDPAVQDLQEAVRLDPEHLLSLNHLGILAEHVQMDFAVAAVWYRKAADLGYAASKVNLGNLLRDGKGVKRDPDRALILYEQAAEDDYTVALVALGEMYLRGGVEQDARKAIELLNRAAEDGVTTAHHHLGFAYEKGRGLSRDYVKAMEHYRVAAMQGYAPSQGALGYLYRRGHGTKKDFIEAVKWYRLAAEQGDATAANRLAWLMATCPVSEVCNGHVALEFARLAVETDSSATNIDSLAAAFARVGEFDQALRVIRELLATKQLSESARTKYNRRIERYQNGIPFQL